MAKPGRSFLEIKPLICTFDLIMFRGGDLVSDAISAVEKASVHDKRGGDYTHVGMAIWSDDLLAPGSGPQQPRRLLVLESTMSGNMADGVPDIDGHAHLGVQLRDLEAVVNGYDANPKTHIAWLPLQEDRRGSVKKGQLAASYDKYKGIFYDASALDLAAAAVPMLRPIRDCSLLECVRDKMCACICCCLPKSLEVTPQESKWLFCSELVANVYRDTGILPANVEPKDVLPCDFLPSSAGSSYGTMDADKKVPWLFTGVVQFHKG